MTRSSSRSSSLDPAPTVGPSHLFRHIRSPSILAQILIQGPTRERGFGCQAEERVDGPSSAAGVATAARCVGSVSTIDHNISIIPAKSQVETRHIATWLFISCKLSMNTTQFGSIRTLPVQHLNCPDLSGSSNSATIPAALDIHVYNV